MTKLVMALSMLALIGAAIVAGLNNRKLGDIQATSKEVTAQYTRLNSDLDQSTQALEKAREKVNAAKTFNQEIKAETSLAEDDNRRKTSELQRLEANFESRRVKLAELDVLRQKSGGNSFEDVKNNLDRMRRRREDLASELTQIETDLEGALAARKQYNDRIEGLMQRERDRRQRVALRGMEADLIAINREMGFVIINAGSDQGIFPEASLLVMRGADRIGRLRIVSVEPRVTVADILPGSVSPGASLMVRDKVIFDNLF